MPFSGWFYTMLSLCKQSLCFYKIYYCCTSRQITPSEQTKMYKYTEWKKQHIEKHGKKREKRTQNIRNKTKTASKMKYKIYTMDGNCERINISVGDFCVCGLFVFVFVWHRHMHTHTHPTVSWEKRNFKTLIFIELSIEDGPFRLQNIFDALCLAYERSEASARELTV